MYFQFCLDLLIACIYSYACWLLIKRDKTIERLRRECSEAYQVIGTIDIDDVEKEKAIAKVLDNLSAAASGEDRPHESVIPFK